MTLDADDPRRAGTKSIRERFFRKPARRFAWFATLGFVAASVCLAGDASGARVSSGLVLPRHLPDDWAVLRAERSPPTENLPYGEYILLAGDRTGITFGRTASVYRYDRGDEEATALATVEEAAVRQSATHTSSTFRSATCGPIVLYATGLTETETRAIARTVACDQAGLHAAAPAGMKQQCASHYRDERIAVLIVGNDSGSTVVFHIFDNACPLAVFIGQPEGIAGRDVLVDIDFDGYRVDCFFRLGNSVIWGQHLGADMMTARAHLEMLIEEMQSVTVAQFDQSGTNSAIN